MVQEQLYLHVQKKINLDTDLIDAITHLSKPTEYMTPKMNLNVKYGLWVIMMLT